MAPAVDDNLVGSTLGNYTLTRKLGQGAMGAVYLAEQVSLRRLVALKVLDPKFSRDLTYIERFERFLHREFRFLRVASGRDADAAARLGDAVGLLVDLDFRRVPAADLATTALASLDEQRAADVVRYGAKSANLGEVVHAIAQKKIAGVSVPPGFGIPQIPPIDAPGTGWQWEPPEGHEDDEEEGK